MLRRQITMMMAFLLLWLGGCSAAGSLRPYADLTNGFALSYPNGMVKVDVDAGEATPVLVMRDLVREDETVNVMVTPFDKADRIEDLGSLAEVGQRVADKIIAPPGSGITAELLNGGSLAQGELTYYLFEYATKMGGQARHEMVTVTISHNELYTLTASTNESRWPAVQATFTAVAKSLRVTT